MNAKNLILTSVLSMAVAMPAFCSYYGDENTLENVMQSQLNKKRLRQDYPDQSQISVAKRSFVQTNDDLIDDAFEEYLAVELLLGLVSE